MKIPVLALFGSKDLQVPPEQNRPPVEAALTNDHSRAETFEGLNHLFQRAGTGAPDEYARIETTLDPQVLRHVSDWILSQPAR